jgi:hypothetical protein
MYTKVQYYDNYIEKIIRSFTLAFIVKCTFQCFGTKPNCVGNS